MSEAHIFLIADDQEVYRRLLARLARIAFGGDAAISFARDGAEAIARLRDNRVDLVITDLRMPRATGLEVARVARLIHPETQVVLVSADACGDEGSTPCDVFARVQKPFDIDVLVHLMRAAAERPVPIGSSATAP